MNGQEFAEKYSNFHKGVTRCCKTEVKHNKHNYIIKPPRELKLDLKNRNLKSPILNKVIIKQFKRRPIDKSESLEEI